MKTNGPHTDDFAMPTRRIMAFDIGAVVLLALAGAMTAVPPQPSIDNLETVAAGPAGQDGVADQDNNEPGEDPAVRAPTAAGQFYPAAEESLHAAIDGMMLQAPSIGVEGVRAILVPHAGYRFSGAVAAASFKQVPADFERVVIIAANHNGDARFDGVSLPEARYYAVPGVRIPVDAAVSGMRGTAPFTSVAAAHTMHMLEVELPFLQYLKGYPDEPRYTIVPMIAGTLDEAQAAAFDAALDSFAADRKTLLLFSVDLSHYYDDETARKLDNFTLDGLLSMDPAKLGMARTDGNQVLQAMIRLARRHGWQPTFLEYRNSGEVEGADKNRVVGYASMVFHPPLSLDDNHQDALLKLARLAVETYVRTGRMIQPTAAMYKQHPVLRLRRGVFVTINKDGQLRGCIGRTFGLQQLGSSLITCAIQGAVEDRRFKPVAEAELARLDYSVSILSFPRLIQVDSAVHYLGALRPHEDGVVMMYKGKQSTYLPHVWKSIPEPEEFLRRLSLKQGAPGDAWKRDGVRLYRYSVEAFSESPEH